jgi:ubiquinone/menaquinone biosynthesis C-methylase UbiE
MNAERCLTRDEARRFYDRFGAKQDSQAFYEEPALDMLVRHSMFHCATGVVELGCGTGRFAERLLGGMLPGSANYRGFDISRTMVELAHNRLRRFGDRASVEQSSGESALPLADASADRFVSTYVLDLLPEDDIRRAVLEAHRVLSPEGLLCLVSMASGATLLSRVVTATWAGVHRLSPRIVGGCRPIRLGEFMTSHNWRVVLDQPVVSWGITSEVVVARRFSA